MCETGGGGWAGAVRYPWARRGSAYFEVSHTKLLFVCVCGGILFLLAIGWGMICSYVKLTKSGWQSEKFAHRPAHLEDPRLVFLLTHALRRIIVDLLARGSARFRLPRPIETLGLTVFGCTMQWTVGRQRGARQSRQTCRTSPCRRPDALCRRCGWTTRRMRPTTRLPGTSRQVSVMLHCS